jgi:thiol:disulfide interchange protein DsbD
VKKTMGAKNLDYEITHFNINTQPLYAILDHKGNPLNKPMGLNTDVDAFLKFMEEGKAAFTAK